MISEKQLSMYEGIAYDCCFFDLQKIILELIAEVRRYNLLQKQFAEYQKQFADTVECLVQTRREADWLAEKCEVMSKFAPFIPVSKDEFREEARKAVQDD